MSAPAAEEKNILLRLAFNGAAYHGFQVQGRQPTVCKALQDAMQQVLGARPDVKGCSRTDAGVHARDFGLSFFSGTAIPMEKLPLALNGSLPPDIRVHSAQLVPGAFHARYSALGKVYRYEILNSAVDDVFAPGLYYRVPGGIDHAAMHAAAQSLVGRHSFAAFMSAGSTVQDTVRTMRRLEVRRQDGRVIIETEADGYLYNMVRIIAGTLLAVGQGRLPEGAVAGILAGQSRQNAGDTLPARGLFLHRVLYAPAAADE